MKTVTAALLLLCFACAAFAAGKDGPPGACGPCAKNLSQKLDLAESAGLKVPEAPPMPAAPAGWAAVGDGAWVSAGAAPGGTLFIGYAGYGADRAGARNWAAAVAAAKGWKAVVAVAGPDKVYYEGREKLAANKTLLAELIPALSPSRIVVAAHSSGSFVAGEFMALLAALGRKDLLKKISYYDVDGGPCGPCRKYAEDPANEGFVFRCVSAAQPGGPTAPNMGSMKSCGKYYAELKAEGSGCSGAWCLHGWLVNRAAAALDPVRPRVRDYYLSPSISPCTDYLADD